MSLANQFNTRPLYQQVADEFISRIISGAWQPGQAIENESDLARSLGISLGTVRKAFDILGDYDLLERQQGKGTIVAHQVGTRSRFSNLRDGDGERVAGEIEIEAVALEVLDAATAQHLAINARTPVLAVSRRRTHQGRTFMIERAYLRVDASAQQMDEQALRALARSRWANLDLAISKRETVAAGACSAEDAVVFGVAEGAAVLNLQRVILSYRGKPLELRYARCHLGAELTYVSA